MTIAAPLAPIIALSLCLNTTTMAARASQTQSNPPSHQEQTQAQQLAPHPDDLIVLDGELTSGSTLIFYTGQQVHLINGRVNGLWFGSFWPDSPPIFETENSLHQLWTGPRRIFLFTYNPTTRVSDLNPYGAVHTLASAGGKTILTNR